MMDDPMTVAAKGEAAVIGLDKFEAMVNQIESYRMDQPMANPKLIYDHLQRLGSEGPRDDLGPVGTPPDLMMFQNAPYPQSPSLPAREKGESPVRSEMNPNLRPCEACGHLWGEHRLDQRFPVTMPCGLCDCTNFVPT